MQLASAPTELHAEHEGDAEPSHTTAPVITTSSAEAHGEPQVPVTSGRDSIWGIPTPVFGAVAGAVVGGGIGFGGAALLFRRGRRHTLTDRAEDQRRQDALQQRIDARDNWKDEYNDIETATSGVLALCVDAERPLCQHDPEAQQITDLLRKLRVTIREVRGKCSTEVTESLTRLCTCLTDLEKTLLPPRALLTDTTTNGQHNLLDLAAQSTDQARAVIQLETAAQTARTTADTEWGTLPTT
ncbi:hypothetical protein ABZ307_42410 [Streptomyces griseorubiginosus]|uniref:hypothetical protein n=1 Tax=Streptomyces griseorubiginosus TaxID=67304 RepID=UPI0033B58B8F